MHYLLKAIAPILQTLHRARVLRDFFVYSFGSVLLRAFSFVMLPFLMRILSPSDYGALSLITAFISIGSMILGLGLRQFLSLEYFHQDKQNQIQLLADLLGTYSSVAIPIILLLFILSPILLKHIFFNAIGFFSLIPTLLSLFLFFYVELFYQFLQYERLSKKVTVLQLAIALITVLCTYFFVWKLQWGIAGVIWAQCIGHCIAFTIAASTFLQTGFFPKSSLKKIKSHLFRGLPFIPGLLSSWILASSDRWMLGYYQSMQEVGVYAVADLFAQLFNFVVLVPWAGSYLPYILKKYRTENRPIETTELLNQKIMWLALTAISSCIACVPLVKPILFLLLPKSYHAAFSSIWILLLGQTFLLGSYFNSALLQFRKRTFFLALSLLIPAVSNIVLNWLLISSYGISGCAWATCLSYAFYFCLTGIGNYRERTASLR